MQKLTTLPFGASQHHINSMEAQVRGSPTLAGASSPLPDPPPPAIRDSQPSVTNGIIIMVAGDIKVEGEERPLKFSQVCIPQGAASA